ncbi:unnamed protein product [Microthlaspi erraticum]|uniref:Uncharacterized protein n=1 Tax=Microthlaspi erraticum TaxID=1685480 RepID=A0A6D2I0H6_9BRAS|nr:unnamed protein product [Microthlaspi erraticum]
MMSAGSVDGMFRNILEGCISSCDSSIERRPYHKNCSCALHDRSCGHRRSEIVSFPIRRSWSEGNNMALHLTSSSSSSNLHSLSPSSSICTLASLSSTASLTMSDIDSSP